MSLFPILAKFNRIEFRNFAANLPYNTEKETEIYTEVLQKKRAVIFFTYVAERESAQPPSTTPTS